jgi:Tfp pilus assembly protein PilF
VDFKSNVTSFLKNSIFLKSNDSKILYNYNDFLEVNRWAKRSQGTNSPVRIIKYPVSNKTNFDFNQDTVSLFKLRFSDNETSIKHKPTPHSTFLTMKQKRYKRRKLIPARVKFQKDASGNNTKKIR